MALKRQLISPRLRKNRRRKILIHTGIDIALFVAVVILVAQVLRIPVFLVGDITVSGAAAVSAAEVEQTVRDTLDDNYVFLFPKKNVLILPRRQLKNRILSEFKRVDAVDVDAQGLDAVAVIVSERKAVAQWCREKTIRNEIAPQEESGEENKPVETVVEECFLVDRTGFVFAEASHSAGRIILYGPLSEEVGESKSPVGLSYLGAERFGTLLSALDDFDELGLPVRFVGQDGSYFEAGLEKGGRVIFNADDNFGTVVENLRSILSSDEFRLGEDGNLPAIDYIDLRFGNKVFFKTAE